jgi:NAD(P)-dependent dehydrogenase (short-subunit alcohol dehydrogenase family)
LSAPLTYPTAMDLNGLTALVTGSNRSIGRAITEELASRRLDLLLCGVRSVDGFEPLEAPPGGVREVRPMALDLSTRESIDKGAAPLPPVDLLVNNAGLMTGGLLEGVLHLVTPGVATDMLDATRQVYGRHMDAAAWDEQAPEEWAAKVVHAIERDDHVPGPGGRLALAKLASRGPAALLDTISGRMFTREPR